MTSHLRFLDRAAISALAAAIAHDGPLRPDDDPGDDAAERATLRARECRAAYDYAVALWAERESRLGKENV